MNLPAIPDKNDPHPWQVFVESTGLHEAPRVESKVLRALAKGDQVSGTVHTNPVTDEDWLAMAEGYVSLTTVVRPHPANCTGGNLVPGREVIDRWWGLPLDYKPDDLVNVPADWTIRDGKEYLVRRESLEVLIRMLEAARADGVEIRVLSAWRSIPYQLGLYTRAIERNGRSQRASAPPGHSEHHLGTTVDLCDDAQREVLTEAFADTTQGRWLAANAARFGFNRSYTRENTALTGYISEPWHWRHLGDPAHS